MNMVKTGNDVEYARFIPTPHFVRHNYSNEYIALNSDMLLQEYHAFHAKAMDSAKVDRERYLREKNAFATKVCEYCGGNLRYIDSYDFWGCSNYRIEGKHSSFSGKDPIFRESKVIISVNWLTDIIETLDMKGRVKAKELLQFYQAEGLEDLRFKHGYSETDKRINGLIKAKARSREQEQLALIKLQTMYPKVIEQQCINYKLKDKKETFCIPDFIAGNRKEVLVVDAKLDYTNDQKMQLYVDLVKFIVRQKGDGRPVNGAHIMYHEATQQTYNGSAFRVIRLTENK